MNQFHSFRLLILRITLVMAACWSLLVLKTTSLLAADPIDVSAAELTSLRRFAGDFCIDCHSNDNAEGDLSLTSFGDPEASEMADAEHWEQIVDRLRSRQMPPSDADRPSEQAYNSIVKTMETVLDRAVAAHPRPGRTEPIRRLNRTEYRNSIRDLLALDVGVDALLPADQSGHGFDNVTVGGLSPVLLSRYITAAEQISRVAVGGPQRSPGGITVRLPADFSQENHVVGLPLGTRGGTLIEHNFPVGGEYQIQVRLTRDRDENLEGLTEEHEIHVLVNRKLEHAFTVAPPKRGDWGKDDTLIDANLKKRFTVSAGPQQIGVTFPNKSSSLSEIKRQPFDASFNHHRHPRKSPAIFEVSIVGPFGQHPHTAETQTPSRRKIFTHRPDAADQGNTDSALQSARKVLTSLIRLAYRRPVTEHDLAVPLRFFAERFSAEGSGDRGFDAGIESALSAILVNPHFLLRAERQPTDLEPGTPFRVTSHELASRLSYFLWSSLPDSELLDVADSGRLTEPGVLSDQVTRMLADKRSDSLVSNFAAQWLYLRNLDSFRPDMRMFPDFDNNLRQSMRRETELLFSDVMKRDRSVLDLIDTNTTFLNERLARHYEIRGVSGSNFRPVKLDQTASHRGGLLRHASILSVTSYATRTSPTIRGAWVLENIFGTPPPPAPPNVPSLKEKAAAESLTVRERLAQHRANPACASCHDLIDPVGFALENYDAVGRWRVFDAEQPLDSSGVTPDGTTIASVGDLEAQIMKRPELFVSALTEKLMTYALGRGIEFDDKPAVRQVVRHARNENYRFSSLIEGIVLSPTFQFRVAE